MSDQIKDTILKGVTVHELISDGNEQQETIFSEFFKKIVKEDVE